MEKGEQDMSEITLNKNNFKAEVLDHQGLVLVDFFASWCGPCKMLAPVISEFAEKNADSVKVGKADIDEAMEIAQEYRIASVPTLILFQDGKPIKQSVGFASLEQIEQMTGLKK